MAEVDWPTIHLALGQMVTTSARVEELARYLALEMCGGGRLARTRGALLLDGLNDAAVLERVERLSSHILEGPLQADVYTWVDGVREWRKHRNELMHGSWADRIMREGGEDISPGTTSGKIKNPRRGFESQVTEWSPTTVEAVRQEGGRLAVAGLKLMTELQAHARAEGHDDELVRWARKP